MSLSPFSIWLHPFRAAAELERLAGLLEASGAEAEALRAELARGKELMQAGEDTRAQMQKRIADLEMLAGSLREQLEEARIEESQLREIEEGMTRMERGRESDRRRVAQLKEELADARREIARLTGHPTSSTRKIDMTAPDSDDSTSKVADGSNSMPDMAPHSSSPASHADDWLIPLPD